MKTVAVEQFKSFRSCGSRMLGVVEFRANETSNANRCECVVCQNRNNGDFIITSNRTLTNDELAMLKAQRSGDKNYVLEIGVSGVGERQTGRSMEQEVR